MKDTKIAWCDATFNPWHGCTKVSDGCKNCYAETLSKRFGNDVWGVDKPRRFFGAKHWAEPLKWNKEAELAGVRKRVFCGSMCDVFETRSMDNVGAAREQLAELIYDTTWLTWLLLTKRIEQAGMLLYRMFGDETPDNLWIGTTIENQAAMIKRIHPLMDIWQPSTRFISVEPMLGPVILPMETGILDWVIVGGESGPGCRTFNPDWARSLRDQCQERGIKFFMKQLGGVHNHLAELDDLPEDLRIREFPGAHS